MTENTPPILAGLVLKMKLAIERKRRENKRKIKRKIVLRFNSSDAIRKIKVTKHHMIR